MSKPKYLASKIQRAGNMTTSIAISGWIFIGLVTAVLCDDGWWTSSNVLFDTNTPVYFLRSDENSEFGHKLIPQNNAMTNLKNKGSHTFSGPRIGTTDIDNEELQSDEWFRKLNLSMSCVAPSIVYPRIVVVVDFGLYNRHGRDLTRLLEYLIAVWNGVDLNFRELEHPRLRLNIAGIVVADRADSLPFLSQPKNRRGQVDITRVMKEFVKFIEADGSSWSSYFNHSHTAVLMTSLDTNWPEWTEIKATHVSRPMCTDIDTKGPPGRLVFSDNGDWSRITRELTYQLGNTFETSVYEDGGGICLYKWSVVTSWLDNNYRPEMPVWSKCSLDSFKKRLNTKDANCLHEKPKMTSVLPRVLPGQILKCQDRCKADRFSRCTVLSGGSNDFCKEYGCAKSHAGLSIGGESKKGGMYPADGETCRPGKICFRRECVFPSDVE